MMSCLVLLIACIIPTTFLVRNFSSRKRKSVFNETLPAFEETHWGVLVVPLGNWGLASERLLDLMPGD